MVPVNLGSNDYESSKSGLLKIVTSVNFKEPWSVIIANPDNADGEAPGGDRVRMTLPDVFISYKNRYQ